jgi:hypothetical protein
MPLPTRRSYAGGAAACTLSSTINSSATSFSITGTTTGWPATAGGGFYMVIDPGLSTEEKVFVGARTSGSLSSVTRGVDGTLAASHDSGATCYPVFTAVDANEANDLASTMTTKGDLISTDGSDPARLGVGTNNHRLVAASGETTGLKWVADTQNTVADAKGDLLVGTAADTIARLAVGSNDQMIVAASGETTGLKWVDGGAWTSFTPTWKFGANTITTSTNIGYYAIVNGIVFVRLMMRYSSAAAGGDLSVTLPSACAIANDTASTRVGVGEITDVSATQAYAVQLYADSTSTTVFKFVGIYPGWIVSDSSPFAWLGGDEVHVRLSGRKA